MKNPIFFLAVIFVFLSNSFVIGQSNNSLSKDFKLIQIHQLDLVSAEMMSLVSMMLKEQNLLEQQKELAFAANTENTKVTLELTLTSKGAVSNWDSPNFSTTANKDFLSTASVQQFEDLYDVNSIQDLKLQVHKAHLSNLFIQNSIGENVKSIMNSSNTMRWVELENNAWFPNDIENLSGERTETPAKDVQINNWKGQLGQGVGSYF